MAELALDDYRKAYKKGKKEYQNRISKGLRPSLEVLENELPQKESLSMEPLGLVQIPIDQIVGTRYSGRSTSFASNFMPIVNENSEFAMKWMQLATAHVEEGIRDPIKAYEYMNKFYVEEGNKRVSVMKYFGAVSIPGTVTRILPKRTQEKENRIYYEFLDFYKVSKVNYIWFSEEGSFKKLLDLMGKDFETSWSDDDELDFGGVYNRFVSIYNEKGGEKISITPGDAFLSFISVHGYEEAVNMTTSEMEKLITDGWDEFVLHAEKEEVALKMDPQTEKKPLISLLQPGMKGKIKVAFIYEKTPGSSAWTYSHELGRLYLEQTFAGEVSTISYENVTADTIEETINKALEEECSIIFTTTPAFTAATVEAAIENKGVYFLNCSLNTSHKYIRTYYSRMHEAKFVMGAVAGAMADSNKLVYIADYPLFGTIANINAFALGAKMVNPRAKIDLEWTCVKDVDYKERIRTLKPDIISGKDMIVPDDESRYFGVFYMEDGYPRTLALPLCHWGKFYEKLIRTIMDRTWKYDDDSPKAVNYWWGMSSDVVDVICSKQLPVGTKRLVDLLKQTIRAGKFNPFSGVLYSQTGLIMNDPDEELSPEEIMKMDWLVENVEGSIPNVNELLEEAKPAVSQQGIKAAKEEENEDNGDRG